MKIENYMKNLPIELYSKIMYQSGLCSPEAQLIKDLNRNLIIPFENVIYNKNENTYINHLINMGILKNHYHRFIEYLFIVG
tara:strand:- start:314 stop:556 length:243 start_codon:yes stop_codon:yes gene_type:complete